MGESTKNKYVVCLSSSWIRDAQYIDTTGLNDDEFSDCDVNPYSPDYDWLWCDIDFNAFIGVVEASCANDACNIASIKYGYDVRTLYAERV